MILITNAKILGKKNKDRILIGNDRIVDIFSGKSPYKVDEVFDACGKTVIPGLIDQHIHITGGGGEGGFHTRVPEIGLSKLVEAGITTAVGLLGTDSETRSVENLVAKSIALTNEGIKTYSLTGSYAYPSPTITGSIKKDIIFINQLIGVKIAINDHRDSSLSYKELQRIGSEARIAGMISGKSGHVTIHMGDGKFYFEQINDALKYSNLPITTFRPTHVNRNKELYGEAIKFATNGGYIDLTTSMSKDLTDIKSYKKAKESNVLDKITFSSDGFGSWSNYDDKGNLIEIGYSPVNTGLKAIKELVKSGEKLEDAIKPFTSNVAKALKLDKEIGYLKKGYIANLLLLDENLDLDTVISNGKFMMKDKNMLVKGIYE
ncbi:MULTISPECIES: beta-aspartyl-peptidase [Anaerococcus]|uniref:Isoaspartyl dipeptidase n=1 Tax=Anaerococcus nagyae TaxID=1755241 RepID=A0A3E2TKN4_9FIRM|nr:MULTISPECIES: beta-aspartyl-peptidase [Anaerococcus]MDU1829250.1 beta-aspartyl-peptidase [Anaerococcus sp.]MDU1864971.1 beta-aspartyl-peptidase [Anaerococcus sp.]RGB77903.1 beta-aspartyl-peptidase [Anaerococcus nagyae]